MSFQSNALWPAGVCATPYGDNISTDTHSTEEQALAVCRGLESEGFGGQRTHFPVATWVSTQQDPPQIPAEVTAELEARAADLAYMRNKFAGSDRQAMDLQSQHSGRRGGFL